MIKWSSTTRLDDYYTLKALRRQIELADKSLCSKNKSRHKLNEELTLSLFRNVDELIKTMTVFGLLSSSPPNMKKETEILKRIREDLGEVFLCSLRVANSLDIDVSQSVHDKIYPVLKESETPWKKD